MPEEQRLGNLGALTRALGVVRVLPLKIIKHTAAYLFFFGQT